jgi:hypothetical protein
LVRAYKEGVPMGGGLPVTRQSSAPKLLIVADKDPLGANLDRVQVVKGWLDANGHSQEQVYNVAWSHPEQRQLDAQGALPAVGNTVDIATGKYTNSIGTNNLSVVWSDPDFNPALSAFYYVRVLEIPTPRWPVFDAIRYGVELPDDAVLIHQERAYSSPVWYQHH